MSRQYSTVVSITLALLLAVTGLGFTPAAGAHIKNEASQFPDIEFSDARFDIVVLVGAGIIPETPVFEPAAPLSQYDLAAWAALARDLGAGGETPDTDALAKAALEQGLVEGLSGQATYAQLNRLFFDGQARPEDPSATPSKGEAASFIASRLADEAGQALLESIGIRVGPSGEVSGVESRSNPAGGSSYFITVAGTTLPMSQHGRVANGPTDLIQWQGRTVRRSFIGEAGGSSHWIYLEAAPREAMADANGAAQQAGTEEQAAAPATSINRNLLYGLIAAVVILGLALFFRRRRVA